ncbi:MAG TPA: hypothetical protein PLI96_08050, partial [Halothiobacillus sp.]|nr:hypothetical protein [Halothiobacillus sp.]
QRALRIARGEGLPPDPNEACLLHQTPENDCIFCQESADDTQTRTDSHTASRKDVVARRD